MARPRKKGLDYIQLDAHFFNDIRVRKLNVKYSGGKASFIYLRLLTEIYQNGFYIKLDEDDIQFLAYESRFRKDVFKRIINDLIEYDFFDRELYEKFGVLTSVEIQKDYFSIKNSKSSVTLRPAEAQYLLIDISNLKNIKVEQLKPTLDTEDNSAEKPAENQPKSDEFLTENQPEIDISIVKNSKSKVEESKEEGRKVKQREIPTEFSGIPSELDKTLSPPKNLNELFEKIIELFPPDRQPQNGIEVARWYDDFRQLLQNLSYDELEEVILYALQDKFWRKYVKNLGYLLRISPSANIPYWQKLKYQLDLKKSDSLTTLNILN